LCRRRHRDWRGGALRQTAMLSLQRCSLIQPGEEYEMFDSLAPAKGILLGLLISTLFWTCLGLGIRSLDSARCRPWHAGRLASFAHLAGENDGKADRHGDH
jgi:hypothetical protein